MQKTKKLAQLWQQKLKASGFNDIENELGMLHSWDSFRFANIDPEHFYAVRDKYIDAAQLPELYQIRNALELKIWLLYSDGFSYREIAELVSRNKEFIQRTIWKFNSVLCQIKGRENDDREG